MTSFTVSMLKTNEDKDFPWEVGVKENGVLVFFDYFSSRPAVKEILRMKDDQDLRIA